MLVSVFLAFPHQNVFSVILRLNLIVPFHLIGEEELTSQDEHEDLQALQKRRLEIKNEVHQFSDQCRGKIRQILSDAGDMSSLIPSWSPVNSGDESFMDHISQLAIPVVDEAPSLLLHGIGEEGMPFDEKHAQRISSVFSFNKHVCVPQFH
jgi:hypothetical protein